MTDPVSPQQLRFGPFTLKAEPLQLWQGAEQIALRPKSLEMLRYLAARAGRLVSKEELLERVWPGRVINRDGIRVCVREIRATLGDTAAMPQYLETVTVSWRAGMAVCRFWKPPGRSSGAILN
jgi:DNA-binding winged helix-turn-helix (wHTH) protein